MSEGPHLVYLKICKAIVAADREVETAFSDTPRIAELLKWHLDEDVEILGRHYPEHSIMPYKPFCFGCGFDGQEERREPWPCPEVRGVAKALGVELRDL